MSAAPLQVICGAFFFVFRCTFGHRECPDYKFLDGEMGMVLQALKERGSSNCAYVNASRCGGLCFRVISIYKRPKEPQGPLPLTCGRTRAPVVSRKKKLGRLR